MKFNNMASLLVKSVAALAVSASMSYAGVSGKGVVPPPPPAPEPAALFDTIGATLSTGYTTRNYFRGLWISDNTVSAALDLAVPLTEQVTWNLGALWMTNLDDDGNHFNFARVAPPGVTSFDYSRYDLYTSLDYDLGFGTLSAGYRHYFYPNSFSGSMNGAAAVIGAGGYPDFGVKDAGELSVVFGTSFVGFDWNVGYYYDFRVGGSYYETNLSYEIPVTPWMSLVPAFQAGYGNDYYSGGGNQTNATINGNGVSSGFTHFTFTLGAPIALTPTAALTPYISWISSDRTRNYLNNSANNEIFGGVSLSVSF